MKSTGAVITEILETYGNRNGQHVRIAEIAQVTGLSAQELAPAITELLECDDFTAEPEPFGIRITAEDRAYGPTIGGEQRHLVRFL
jgi:hypothetical protein